MSNSNSIIKGKMIELIPGYEYSYLGKSVEYMRHIRSMSGAIKYKFIDAGGETILLTRPKVILQITKKQHEQAIIGERA